jgi:hypothetical protein
MVVLVFTDLRDSLLAEHSTPTLAMRTQMAECKAMISLFVQLSAKLGLRTLPPQAMGPEHAVMMREMASISASSSVCASMRVKSGTTPALEACGADTRGWGEAVSMLLAWGSEQCIQ